jgi:DNA-binding CsgD family transcriptional regulator
MTQAKRLDQVEHMARDLVALMEDVSADDVQLSLTVRVGDELDTLRQRHERLRREAEAATEAAKGAREELMRKLQAARLSARDIADITGVSHQRVSQLVGSVKRVRDVGRAAVAVNKAAARGASAAKKGNSRSAVSGRYVSGAAAVSKPRRAPVKPGKSADNGKG